MSWPVVGGGGGGSSDSMVMWFQGLRQRNQPREPARPGGQSNDVRPRDQSTGPWFGGPQSQLSGYIFSSRQDTVVF